MTYQYHFHINSVFVNIRYFTAVPKKLNMQKFITSDIMITNDVRRHRDI